MDSILAHSAMHSAILTATFGRLDIVLSLPNSTLALLRTRDRGCMSKPKEKSIEPDAWERFERAVDVVAKSPPQHRTKAIKRRKPSSKRKRPKLSPRSGRPKREN